MATAASVGDLCILPRNPRLRSLFPHFSHSSKSLSARHSIYSKVTTAALVSSSTSSSSSYSSIQSQGLGRGIASLRIAFEGNWKVHHQHYRSAFARSEAVRHMTGSFISVEGHRFAVVVARFNEIVTKLLLEGALDTFKKHSVNEEDINVVWVPGSFEIGVVAQRLGKSQKYQAILCIGAVAGYNPLRPREPASARITLQARQHSNSGTLVTD